MISVLEGHGWGQRAQRRLSPMALQSTGDGGLVVLTPVGTAWGQLHRIARTGEARTEHGQARHPGAVADDRRHLTVHRRARLVPRLDGLAGRGEEPGALAEGAAEPAELVRGPERTGQQPPGMAALAPLAVLHVTCGPALDVLAVLRVDHEPREATGLAPRKEGEPRDPRGCHGDRGERPRDHPGRQGVESGRVGGKAAHRLGIITGRDRHILGFGPDVNARGVEVGSSPRRRERGLGVGVFLLA